MVAVKVLTGLFFLVCFWTVAGETENPGRTVWDEIYPEIEYGDFRHPDKIKGDLLRIIHGIVREVGGGMIVHSDYRPQSKSTEAAMLQRAINSHHGFGAAVDFRLDSYANLSREEILDVYYKKTQLIENFLQKHGLADKVGLGIYPFMAEPFWHVDVRDRRGRWCRNKKKRYVGYASCKREMKREIASE